MVKVIFFDVDGTLISHTHGDIPQSTRKALDALKEKGIKRVLATGRHMVELEDLPISSIDFDAYILLNGQICLDQDGIFYSNPMEDLESVISMFNEKKLPIQILEKDRFYINYVDDRVKFAQAAISTPVPDVSTYQGDDVYQVILFADKEEEEELRKQSPYYTITRWNEYGIDFVSKGASKVVGIQKYIEKEGIDLSETMAFGDGENDIEMLKYVGIGVAMGNSSDVVKKEIPIQCEHIDDDGLEKELIRRGIL